MRENDYFIVYFDLKLLPQSETSMHQQSSPNLKTNNRHNEKQWILIKVAIESFYTQMNSK